MDDSTNYTYQLIQEFGNEYAATMYVARKTRELLTKTNNALTESEAISWIISRKPESELQDYIKARNSRIINRKYSLLNEYLALIDDKELRTSFQNSALQSIKSHKLIICYNQLDSASCTRLRILLKQYWLEHLETELPDATLHLA